MDQPAGLFARPRLLPINFMEVDTEIAHVEHVFLQGRLRHPVPIVNELADVSFRGSSKELEHAFLVLSKDAF